MAQNGTRIPSNQLSEFPIDAGLFPKYEVARVAAYCLWITIIIKGLFIFSQIPFKVNVWLFLAQKGLG